MRTKYRWDEEAQKMVEVFSEEKARDARNNLSSDCMEATKHPVTGKVFTSKSKFRAETRAVGCVEVGNEYANGWTPPVDHAKEERLKEARKQIIAECLH